MEKRFYHDDFEDLIKQKADQYKMYPSEKVWKQIHQSLHPGRKWYWVGFALLLTGVGFYSINELAIPSLYIPVAQKHTDAKTDIPVKEPAQLVPFTVPSIRPSRNSSLSPLPPGENDPSDQESPAGFTSDLAKVVQLVPEGRETDKLSLADVFSNNQDMAEPGDLIEHLLSSIDALEETPSARETKPVSGETASEDYPRINWLHEYAAFELGIPKRTRIEWSVHFAPTMNYRKLTGSRNAYMPTDVKTIPVALRIPGELDGLVNHKPAIGFELGTSVRYILNKDFTLRGGIQFNYSRYAIAAYSSPGEVATIALTNNYRNESISNYTSIRNFGGDAVKDIQNQYFQLSAPVGLEWRIMGRGKLQFHIAGTLQPTYLLNRNTYLITTDYKNYTKEPSLVRRWNVNTSAEAYISYKTGGVRWQVGPQFRYQALSSYVSKYPISEHLMEYGIKVGVSKTIR